MQKECYVCKRELVLGLETFVGLCLKHYNKINDEDRDFIIKLKQHHTSNEMRAET